MARNLLSHRLNRRRFIGASAATLAGLAAYGCAPPGTPRTGESAARAGVDRSASATLEMGAFGAPDTMTHLGVGGGDVGGDLQVVCHSALSILDHDANIIPMLAERLPSIEDGSWVLNPNGTMRLTWHLRRNAKWHDGHPFTSKDVRFSWEFGNDPATPARRTTLLENVTAIDTPDDYTAVMHWKVANVFAHVATRTDLHIYPEHIVRPLIEGGDMQQLMAHPYSHEGFVGLGPYRIERWTDDGTIVFKRFEDFFLGPPKIGTIVHHTTANAIGVLTLLLAGAIHRTSRNGLGFEEGLIARDQWEAKGEGIVYFMPIGFRRLLLPPDTLPLFRDLRLRKALLMAIDRDQLVNTLYAGQARVAHIPLSPQEPGYRASDAGATKYPYDPRRALALLEEAGWRRGSDGVLANAAGERLEFPFRVPVGDTEQVRLQGAVAGFWSEIGVRVRIENATDAQLRDRQFREAFPGASTTDAGPTIASLSRRWHSRQVPRAETRYVGDNAAHWAHLEADRTLDQLDNSFRAEETEALLAQLSKLFSDELPALPLYYTPEATAAHKNLKGGRPRPAGSGQNSWNWSCYQWEWTG